MCTIRVLPVNRGQGQGRRERRGKRLLKISGGMVQSGQGQCLLGFYAADLGWMGWWGLLSPWSSEASPPWPPHWGPYDVFGYSLQEPLERECMEAGMGADSREVRWAVQDRRGSWLWSPGTWPVICRQQAASGELQAKKQNDLSGVFETSFTAV